MTALAPLLQAFFADRLAAQRHASPHTIAAYRDSFRLLLDVRAPADRQDTIEARSSRISTRRRSQRSSDTSRPSVATACAPATHA